MSPSSRTDLALARVTGNVATVFLAAVLCVFPLYIDHFSNLGLTKFTGGFTLLVAGCLALLACAAIGAKAPAGRLSARDGVLPALGVFVAANLLATVFSLSPVASAWGLGSYYGGLMLVLLTAGGYLAMRAFAVLSDLPFVFFGIGVTASIVAVLYLLNIFNIDLIGAYENTAVVERAQFFSTLGQKDFCGGFFAIALPLVFYAYLQARGAKQTLLYGVPMIFGALAMAIVDAEALTLGIVCAAMILVCHKDFTTREVRRGAWIGVAFFLWAGWMHWMRASVYTQGGKSILAHAGDWQVALPGTAFCLAVFGWLQWRAVRGKPEIALYRLGRALTALTIGVTLAAVLLANFWPGFPSLGALDNFLVFNKDWGTWRGTAWQAAFGAWWDAPLWRKLVGYGPGMMHQAVEAWAGDAMTARLATFYAAHNEFLEQLLTTGLLGLAGWVAFLTAALRRGFAAWGRPGAAPVLLALCSYLAQSVVSIRVSMLFPLVMLLFGVLAVSAAPEPPAIAAESGPKARRRQQAKPAAPSNPLRRWGALALAAVATMAVCAPLSHLLLWFLF